MGAETTLAKTVAASSDKQKYDAACKRLLSEKIILAWIMKNTIKEYASYTVQEIADNYIEGTPQVGEIPVLPDETNSRITGTGVEDITITEGSITYDIRFFAILPRNMEMVRMIINLEAQNDFYPGYPLIKRAIYYCSRMISAQYGTEFTNSHYEKIKKVYSIWICMNPPKKRQNSITKYSITEENLIGDVKEPYENYDLITAIMICLGNSDKSQPYPLLNLLDVLLSSDADINQKKQLLENNFQIPMSEHLERSVSEMCNLSKGIEDRGIEKGIEQGIEKGIEQGIEQGIEKGIEKGILSSIKNLMESMSWSPEQAMDALKLSADERGKYISALRQ